MLITKHLLLEISLTIFIRLSLAQISVTTASGTRAPVGPFRRGQLIFEDNFEFLDHEKWEHENTMAGGGNNEFQFYTNNRSNSYCEDGKLHIVPTPFGLDTGEDFLRSGTLDIHGGQPADYCTNHANNGCLRTGTQESILPPIKSARMRTVQSFNFKYGILEIRAKNPTGDWLWPALWLMPKKSVYGTWPSSGEIDLMEARGNLKVVEPDGKDMGVQRVESTLHFGPSWYLNGFYLTNFETHRDEGFNNDFHVYRLGWTETTMEFSVDNKVIGFVNASETGGFWKRGLFDEKEPGRDNPWKHGTIMAPFDQEFFIIMNVAVGSTVYFGDDLINDPEKPWRNDDEFAMTKFWDARNDWLPTWNIGTDSSHLQVDYVRVYAL
ncbi:hypothetical protein PVAND_000906 [Polypedilum vanderplanki]|uniref:GH16 domain-containing protein n=1 Tax=Polypedilum vanderplanki TaxID=319348 RepID=A0A9J6BLL3_POLVA|nr:hypothetical protein PVAND_000906 [Polypedilum vanderplanki]